MSDAAKLFIFPPSSGCETAVWLLERYGIDARIDSQTAPFFLLSIRLAGGATYPFLKYAGHSWAGSQAIWLGLEDILPPERSLLPADPEERQRAVALAKGLYERASWPVARWAYHYLLPHRSLLRGPITKGVPWWQKGVVFVAYPLIAWLIGRSLGLAAHPPAAQEDQIRAAFDEVDALLADGRKYLAGDRLSLVDIDFCATAAPAVLEPRYGKGGLLPSIEAAPEPMRRLASELRDRPAGRFIARIYQDHR